MTLRRIALAGLAVPAVAIIWWLAGDAGSDPRTEIGRALDRGVDAAAERDLGALMELVSTRFAGQGMDRDALETFLFLQLRRGDWRRVVLASTRIDVEAGDPPRTARVESLALLASGEEIRGVEDLARTNASAYRLLLGFELERDDEWRVVTATWERVASP